MRQKWKIYVKKEQQELQEQGQETQYLNQQNET